MGGFSLWHIIILALLVMLLFGGSRFSSMMGDVAKGLKSFKQGMAEDDYPPRHGVDPRQLPPGQQSPPYQQAPQQPYPPQVPQQQQPPPYQQPPIDLSAQPRPADPHTAPPPPPPPPPPSDDSAR